MTIERLDHKLAHEWHTAINLYHHGPHQEHRAFQHWMYLAKDIADEVPRLALLFKLEREGGLPEHSYQCSHDTEGRDVPDNHLTCCLGVACRDCEFLKALHTSKMTMDQIDQIKAWTCVSHILTECGKADRQVDTSEGFILTTDDRMYWERVYESLSATDNEDERDEP